MIRLPDLPNLPGAACAEPDADPAWFYPPSGGNWRAHVDLAVEVCNRCPVRARCLAFAIEAGETWGVWGGRCFSTIPRKPGRKPGRPRKDEVA